MVVVVFFAASSIDLSLPLRSAKREICLKLAAIIDQIATLVRHKGFFFGYELAPKFHGKRNDIPAETEGYDPASYLKR